MPGKTAYPQPLTLEALLADLKTSPLLEKISSHDFDKSKFTSSNEILNAIIASVYDDTVLSLIVFGSFISQNRENLIQQLNLAVPTPMVIPPHTYGSHSTFKKR